MDLQFIDKLNLESESVWLILGFELMKAVWNDVILAESGDIVTLEGNTYFPMDSLKKEYFDQSKSTSLCLWKGKASYFSVTVNGEINKNCAWYYPKPSFLAKKIKNRVAFWQDVQIIK